MDNKYKCHIYTRKCGYEDTYSFVRTETGWYIDGGSTFQLHDADKKGYPALFSALEHDIVSYPNNVGELLEWVWQKGDGGATYEEVQEALNDIGDWISLCEKNTPRGMFTELL